MAEECSFKVDESQIPVRLRIGATGHRILENEKRTRERVREALQILVAWSSSSQSPSLICVVSALAEGADRIIAEEALAEPGTVLEAVLPLKADDYEADFETPESRAEFRELLTKAVHRRVAPPTESRELSYESTARDIVDHCDALLVLWDGQPAKGQGGTAETVEYALHRDVPVVWISTDGDTHEVDGGEWGTAIRRIGREGDQPISLLGHISWQTDEISRQRRFNEEHVPAHAFEQLCSAHESRLGKAADDAGLPLSLVPGVLSWATPFFVRADYLAQRYHRFYRWAGTSTFLLAALSVAAAATQIVLWPDVHALIWIEVALLVVLLALVFTGRRLHWHYRWIAYRRAAERLRSAPFLAITGLQRRPYRGSMRLVSDDPASDWLRRAFSEAWLNRPTFDSSTVPLPALKRLICIGWLDVQISFHERAGSRSRKRNTRLISLVFVLFVATLSAAVLHLAVGEASGAGIGPKSLLELGAISLPALGGAAAGIRNQGEYDRTAERSDHMAHRLRRLADQLTEAPDIQSLQGLMIEAERLIVDENRDWFTVMKFHEFELST